MTKMPYRTHLKMFVTLDLPLGV